MQSLRAHLEWLLGEPVRADRVEQLTHRLDLLGHHRLRHQPLELSRDPEVRGGAGIEAPEDGVVRVHLNRWSHGVAHGLQRLPRGLAQYARNNCHLTALLLAGARFYAAISLAVHPARVIGD